MQWGFYNGQGGGVAISDPINCSFPLVFTSIKNILLAPYALETGYQASAWITSYSNQNFKFKCALSGNGRDLSMFYIAIGV